MGKYDKCFREEPELKAKAQPTIKREPKEKPVASSRANHSSSPKLKKKDYRKKALRFNGFLLFLNVCFLLTSIELIVLKLLKKYIHVDIDAILNKQFNANQAKYFVIGVISFGFINLLLLIKNIKRRKRIKRSYCPHCGMPYYYQIEDNDFVDPTLEYNFKNTFRDENKETWKGHVEFKCQYCNTMNKVFLAFDTHLGSEITDQNEDVKIAFTHQLISQFEKNKIHIRKK